MSRGLARERFAVDATRDGRAGFELAAAYPNDWIILTLPQLSGTGAGRIHAAEPVLILSTCDALSDIVANMALGGNDYLTQPRPFAEPVVRTKALPRRGPVNRSSSELIGDREFDRLPPQVKRSGRRIDLTGGRGRAILEWMASPGRLPLRNKPIQKVRGTGYSISEGPHP